MQVGDLVCMPGSIDSITGIVLRIKPMYERQKDRVQVYWIEDAEVSWEPEKWLGVISDQSR